MSALAQMKLLMSLAQIDGTVAERERNYIVNIGKANGLNPAEINQLFDIRHELIIPQNLTVDQKFDYVFSLVRLMKIDERMYKEEILFCSKIASTLGYDPEVMFDLMLHVKTASMGDDEIQDLKKLTEKYLKRTH